MIDRRVLRAVQLLAILLLCAVALAACGGDSGLYVPKLLENPQAYDGKTVTVDGAYLGRGNASVLALGVSTLDNGLDAQALGEPIWLDGFPQDVGGNLHQPGDAIYGFVRISGLFEAAGGYGPEKSYKYRIQVASVEPIESVQRTEVRVTDAALGATRAAERSSEIQRPGDYNAGLLLLERAAGGASRRCINRGGR
jgi:hypothetical protein